MTRTGTRRRDRTYNYYSCGGSQQKGKSICRGSHMRMEKLDDLVVANVKDRLFTPGRLAVILESLVQRKGAKVQAVLDRRATLEGELNAKQDKLTRLYRAIEEDVVDIDDELRERIKALKTGRDIAQASLDRIASQISSRAAITPDRIEAFAKLMREKIDTADIHGRKSYLRSVISYVEGDDDSVRIVSEKATQAAVIAGREAGAENVRGFVSNS
jgi:site-specific DNA recombinase